MSATAQPDVNLFSVETQQCPYPAYRALRDEAPVYRCPATGMYVITRFDDVRRVLTDTDNFTNEISYLTDATEPSPRAQRVLDTFEQEGWVPAKTPHAVSRSTSLKTSVSQATGAAATSPAWTW